MTERGPVFDDRFDEGMAEFNAGHFFEAHEIWEEIWIEEEGDRRRFLQALVQAAAGYHKRDLGVPGGARKLLQASLRILDQFPPDAYGLDLIHLTKRIRADLGAVGS